MPVAKRSFILLCRRQKWKKCAPDNVLLASHRTYVLGCPTLSCLGIEINRLLVCAWLGCVTSPQPYEYFYLVAIQANKRVEGSEAGSYIWSTNENCPEMEYFRLYHRYIIYYWQKAFDTPWHPCLYSSYRRITQVGNLGLVISEIRINNISVRCWLKVHA